MTERTTRGREKTTNFPKEKVLKREERPGGGPGRIGGVGEKFLVGKG